MTQKYKIILIDCTRDEYDSQSLKESPVGGIQNCTVNLARQFSSRGHEIVVANNRKDINTVDNVRWVPYKNLGDVTADIVIVNNDATFLESASYALKKNAMPIIWCHNRLKFEKTLRKGRLWPLLKYRPVGVFLSHYHIKATSRLHPFHRRVIIPHGLDEDIFEHDYVPVSQRRKRAVFTSQAYRGFADMVRLWIEKIHPAVPDAEFHGFIGKNAAAELNLPDDGKLKASGIIIHDKVSKSRLFEEITNARLMLYPGHRDETFCLAAAEAEALGTPLVTKGIGSLSERTQHGLSGYIEKDENRLAAKAISLLSDDDHWIELSKNAFESRDHMTWDNAAAHWENMFKTQR